MRGIDPDDPGGPGITEEEEAAAALLCETMGMFRAKASNGKRT